MNTDEMSEEIVETDVLIIGGGLAGCMAAIKAREAGVEVAIMEKSTLRRGGSRGRGLDHYPAMALPEINGVDAEKFGELRAKMLAGLVSPDLSVITALDALKPLVILENIGVTVREADGSFMMQGGRMAWFRRDGNLSTGQEGKPVGDMLFFRGADLKLKLAEEVKRIGARIYERTMFTGLMTQNGSVVGAMGLNTRDGTFRIFKAKTTILATGGCNRLYSYPFAPFPHNLFSGFYFVSNSGVNISAAYRAGAEITNMEYIYVHVLTGGFPWWGLAMMKPPARLVNSKGENLLVKYPPRIGPDKVNETHYPLTDPAFGPDPSTPEIEREVLMLDTSPFGDDAEAVDYRILGNGDPIMLPLLKRRGLKTAPFEARVWIDGVMRSFSGVIHDERGQSSLKRLFVAGDATGANVPWGATGAFVWGYRCGKFAAEDAKGMTMPLFGNEEMRQIRAERDRVFAPMGRAEGIDALELEDMVRRVTSFYVGTKKVEPKLKQGIELLRQLKESYVPELSAANPHELMRTLEAREIINVAELHTKASLIRTETRIPPSHFRLDFPHRDEANWRRNIIFKNVAGQMEYALESLEKRRWSR